MAPLASFNDLKQFGLIAYLSATHKENGLSE